MKTFKQQLDDQCELIQNDLQCLLDGLPDETIDHACQIIVDHFTNLKAQSLEVMIETGPENGGLPVTRYRVKLPENCEVNIDEENGEIIIDK